MMRRRTRFHWNERNATRERASVSGQVASTARARRELNFTPCVVPIVVLPRLVVSEHLPCALNARELLGCRLSVAASRRVRMILLRQLHAASDVTHRQRAAEAEVSQARVRGLCPAHQTSAAHPAR